MAPPGYFQDRAWYLCLGLLPRLYHGRQGFRSYIRIKHKKHRLAVKDGEYERGMLVCMRIEMVTLKHDSIV